MPEPTNHTDVHEGSASNSFIVAEQWGQPPASQYQFRVDGTRMFGMLISHRPNSSAEHHLAAVEAELSEEIRVWDVLSDEALIDFEDDIE